MNELAKVLAQLWVDHLRVTLLGYYEAATVIAPAEQAA